ncbi:MAG: chemotaxis protein CheW [Proteobacteria bacterium]|nr:chemotaxis protein CheW [Pseudomonadota bacterium]
MVKESKFLLFSLGGRFYLCRESLIERIIAIESANMYFAPFGPDWLRYFISYNGMVLPIIKEHEEILCEKMYNVIILKKVFNFVGFLVDYIYKFVNISDDVIEKALNTPVFMAKKAIIYDEKECFLLDIEALLEGRE